MRLQILQTLLSLGLEGIGGATVAAALDEVRVEPRDVRPSRLRGSPGPQRAECVQALRASRSVVAFAERAPSWRMLAERCREISKHRIGVAGDRHQIGRRGARSRSRVVSSRSVAGGMPM